jgi:hypothetical protein
MTFVAARISARRTQRRGACQPNNRAACTIQHNGHEIIGQRNKRAASHLSWRSMSSALPPATCIALLQCGENCDRLADGRRVGHGLQIAEPPQPGGQRARLGCYALPNQVRRSADRCTLLPPSASALYNTHRLAPCMVKLRPSGPTPPPTLLTSAASRRHGHARHHQHASH